MGKILFAVLAVLFATSARADYRQILCLSPEQNGHHYELLLEMGGSQDPVWPARVSLADAQNNHHDLLFTSVDIFRDMFYEPSAAGERRYVAKNYSDEAFRYKEISFILTASPNRIFGEDPFPTFVDFYGRHEPVFQGVGMTCKVRR